PLAMRGLLDAKVDSADVDKYLNVVSERVESRQTGARWILKSFSAMKETGPKEGRLRALTAAMLASQKTEEPLHRWPIVKTSDREVWEQGYRSIGQFMSTDLFTVQPDDLIDLAASVMDWRHIRHVPVEDEEGRLVGLVTHRSLLRLLSRRTQPETANPLTVREIMKTDPVTVSSTTPTLEAMELMRSNKVGCLPVVDDGQLVGIVTSYDFLDASARVFKDQLTVSTHPVNGLAKAQYA